MGVERRLMLSIVLITSRSLCAVSLFLVSGYLHRGAPRNSTANPRVASLPVPLESSTRSLHVDSSVALGANVASPIPVS